MRILGINGSPRSGGNTEILLESFLSGASEAGAGVGRIVLNEVDFVPCQECDGLGDNPGCVIEDGMREVYSRVEDSDVLALASPIFFGSLSAQTKMMVDRFQCIWRAENILKLDVKMRRKKGVFLCVEASKRDDFLANARAVAKNFFATVNAAYAGEVFCRGADAKGAVLKFPGVLRSARELGYMLASEKS